MIIAILYFIAGSFLQATAAMLNTLSTFFPPINSLFAAVDYFLSFTAYFYGVLDVTRAFTDAGIAIGFEVFWFIFLIAWYVIGFFRGLISVGGTSGH